MYTPPVATGYSLLGDTCLLLAIGYFIFGFCLCPVGYWLFPIWEMYIPYWPLASLYSNNAYPLLVLLVIATYWLFRNYVMSIVCWLVTIPYSGTVYPILVICYHLLM